MSGNSGIEWTDATWNPVTGCTKISPGCAHCYAEAITLRFKRGGPFLPGKTTIRTHPDRLEDPKKWRSPKMIFVNSMSDLFHEEISFDFIGEVFKVMEDTPRHIYQILTKRPNIMLEYSKSHQNKWPNNVWAGVSVENQHWADARIPVLEKVPAAIRFLSVEPLIKRVNLASHLLSVDWVIVGGESGQKARPIEEDWVREIRDDCLEAKVPFFFKQWGGRYNKERGRDLDGREWSERPSRNLSSTKA